MKMLVSAFAFTSLIASSVAMFGGAPPEGGSVPPKVDPTSTDNFTWTDPFASRKIKKFDAACEAQRTFSASEYLLHDLREAAPVGLLQYSDELKKLFSGRPFPGGWNGIDAHGYDRSLIWMEYADVPLKAREWIEEQERTNGKGQGLFAVYSKPIGENPVTGPYKFPSAEKASTLRALDAKRAVIFAPGALYENLPLWVAEGSECKDALLDLTKYSSKVADGGVVAWTTSHTEAARDAGKRDIKFTIKAQLLKAKVDVTEDKGSNAKENTKVEGSGKDEL